MFKFFAQKVAFLITILMIGIIFIIPFTFAEPLPAEESSMSDEEKEALKEEVSQELEFLQRLRDELNILTFQYESIDNTIQLAKVKVSEASETKLSLSEQLENIDIQLENTKNQIDSVTKEIVTKENEIELLFEKIEIKKVELEEQKNALSDFIKLAYLNESSYFDFQNNEVSVLKLLLSNKKISDVINDTKYLTIIKDTGKNIVENLTKIEEELEQKQKDLHKKRKELKILKNRLAQEETNLTSQKEGKENLLLLTKSQEALYSKLLADALEEQNNIVNEIQNLHFDLGYINTEIDNLKQNYDPEELNLLFENENLFSDDIFDAAGDLILRWPVSPTVGLSAYYHDPSYKAVFGVAHNAIDIPVPQGTPIHSPAYGVVTKVRDNGFGYSYLVISHSKNVSTLYGHVSNFLVKEGEPVFAGQIVALTGGIPGTLGAGYMTTGAHLHFEVFKNGKHVDPLYYLDLSTISLGNLPAKYAEYYEDRKDFYALFNNFIDLEDQVMDNEDEDEDEEDFSFDEIENVYGYAIEIDDTIEIDDLSELELIDI